MTKLHPWHGRVAPHRHHRQFSLAVLWRQEWQVRVESWPCQTHYWHQQKQYSRPKRLQASEGGGSARGAGEGGRRAVTTILARRYSLKPAVIRSRAKGQSRSAIIAMHGESGAAPIHRPGEKAAMIVAMPGALATEQPASCVRDCGPGPRALLSQAGGQVLCPVLVVWRRGLARRALDLGSWERWLCHGLFVRLVGQDRPHIELMELIPHWKARGRGA